MKGFVWLYIAGIVLVISLWGSVIYVLWHFVSKFW